MHRLAPSSLRAVVGLVAVAATIAASGAVAPASSAAPGQDVAPPTVAAATIAADGDAAEVSWVATGDPHRWKVLMYANGRYVGQRNFPGTARSGRVENLHPGSAVAAWVVPMTAQGGFLTGATTPVALLPPDPACDSAVGTCVHVDAPTTTGAADGVGLGLLHGVTAETDPARIAPLSPRHWRVSAYDRTGFLLADRSGASITALLSDPWSWMMSSPDGRVASPWDMWEWYEWWVAAVAQWHVDNGIVPDRWEVQNEPGLNTFSGSPLTTERLVELHERAARAIRSVIPDAEVVGPSVSPVVFGHSVRDLEAFMAGVAARGFELDGVVWHENVGSCSNCDGGPTAARQHIDDARATLDAVGLGDLPIDITEYATPYEQLQPGAIVGYLSTFIDGDVRFAGTTCWDQRDVPGEELSCHTRPGSLDGLLLADGTTPTDAWWTYRAYAQLAQAGAQQVSTTVNDPATSAVASISGATVRMLVGRHTGCTADDGPCPGGAPSSGPKSVTVRLTPPEAGTWTFVVSRIDSSAGAAGPPVEIARTSMETGTAPVTVGAFSVADGEVLQIEATRA